jgi:sulfur relay (sulfurtransferase) DsrF/TusC family protein
VTKKIAVIIRHSPLNTLRISETLRMSVGLTLADGNAVTVIFIGDGVYALRVVAPKMLGSPEIKKHIMTLKMLGHRLVVEREAIEERQMTHLSYDIELMDRSSIVRLMAESDAVITC